MALRFDNATVQLGRSLDLRLKRQELITSNLVNADTPNYQPKDLEFEGYLQSAQALEAGAKEQPIGRVTERGNVADTLDGNAVNKDEEIGKASDNMIRYTTALELMQRKMALLRYAINGQ